MKQFNVLDIVTYILQNNLFIILFYSIIQKNYLKNSILRIYNGWKSKKASGFRGTLNNGSKKVVYIETENKDFTLQSSNIILNTSKILILFYPSEND